MLLLKAPTRPSLLCEFIGALRGFHSCLLGWGTAHGGEGGALASVPLIRGKLLEMQSREVEAVKAGHQEKKSGTTFKS